MTDDLRKLALAAKAPTPRDPSFADPLLMFQAACTPDVILTLYRERDEARDENPRLRAALAVSKSPCVYCRLFGFPRGRAFLPRGALGVESPVAVGAHALEG